jgi:hypothetical protein
MAQFLNSFPLAGAGAPLGTDAANNIDGYILDGTKKSLDERYSTEHVSLNDATPGLDDDAIAGGQGRHVPGKVGCFGKGTLAQKNALSAVTPPGDGALWLDTDDGLFYRFDLVGTYGGGWVVEQFGSGTIYATLEQSKDVTVIDKAINPATLHGVGNPFINYALFQDIKANNTDAGTLTSDTWVPRQLQEQVNHIDDVSISSNAITLPIGTYRVSANAPAHQVDNHKIAWYSVSNTSYDIIGTCENTLPSNDFSTRSFLIGEFTVIAEEVFELRHRTNDGKSSDGLGKASNFGVSEVYAQVEIWRLD